MPCSVDLHTQKADKAEISEEERARSARTREAAQKLFLSPMASLWIITSRLFPFLLPVIRLLAHRFPDKPLVGLLNPASRPFGIPVASRPAWIPCPSV